VASIAAGESFWLAWRFGPPEPGIPNPTESSFKFILACYRCGKSGPFDNAVQQPAVALLSFVDTAAARGSLANKVTNSTPYGGNVASATAATAILKLYSTNEVNVTTDDNFDWGVLGKDWWMEAMETTRATLTQGKFACARHAGATRTKAAEMAGYSATDAQALRTAGSRADDTKSVQDMLVMASAASVSDTDAPYTVAQARQKIGRMVKTSLDPSTVIKGTELLARLDQVDRDRGQTPEDDGYGEWRTTRDFLLTENGASQFMLYYRALRKDQGWPGSFPLLHDIYTLAQGEPFGQQIFDWTGRNMSEESRKDLEKKLADKKYQLEVRQKIWAEIGIKLESNGTFGRGGANAA
jgi:hypothetical protein